MDRAEQFSDLCRAHFDAVTRYALRRTDPGTARDVLAQVAPSGAVEKTFAAYTRSYSGFPQEGAVTTPCRVVATDAPPSQAALFSGK